jgi:sulfhydrogenase subunit beta (sulfur reductase)
MPKKPTSRESLVPGLKMNPRSEKLDISLGGVPQERFVITLPELDALLTILTADGYCIVAPRLTGAALQYGEIRSSRDLPRGLGQAVSAGHYQLFKRDDNAFFGYAAVPGSAKRYFFAPEVRLAQIRRKGESFVLTTPTAEYAKLAFLGLRSCDLAAIAIQDRIFQDGLVRDLDYAARRRDTLIIAVQCTVAESTCFCESTRTGPEAHSGFDLALTELQDSTGRFVLQVGTERGRALVERLAPSVATEAETADAKTRVEQTRLSMQCEVETNGLRDLLYQNLEHPIWDDIAERCLSCGNCTLACPTCFCSTVVDTSDVTDTEHERLRRWDSCFTLEHSYVHGGAVRDTVKSRYRQWLTHKWAGWIDQFGESGCVGCGRCITLCPASIDMTEELAKLRLSTGDQRT